MILSTEGSLEYQLCYTNLLGGTSLFLDTRGRENKREKEDTSP